MSQSPSSEAKRKLAQVRVAVLYERVTDGRLYGRKMEEVIRLLKETKAQFIFRGFWRWNPCPNRPEQLPGRLRWRCEISGYSYRHLEEAISRIKAEIPHIIFCGAVPAQVLQRSWVWNPMTGEVFRYPQTWEMALDPQKWGLPMSKEKFQCLFGKTHFWVPRKWGPEDYDPAKAAAYFPDLTNPQFHKLLLSWAQRQVDCGADAIWIDMFFTQAGILTRLAKNPNHPAVRETWKAINSIIEGIRRHGRRKGKYILVGSWGVGPVRLPLPPPPLDFVTFSPSSREVYNLRLDEARWRERFEMVRKRMGDTPIFAFIDWAGTTRTPLGVFSQRLSPEKQRQFLRLADEFFSRLGAVFIYPLHGGFMGMDAKILSFGKFKFYDALAPEFRTYETIRELAQRRASSGAEPGR